MEGNFSIATREQDHLLPGLNNHGHRNQPFFGAIVQGRRDEQNGGSVTVARIYTETTLHPR
jgi:hypothetical protein